MTRQFTSIRKTAFPAWSRAGDGDATLCRWLAILSVLGGCLFGSLLLSGPAAADDVDDLRAEVEQLKQQLQNGGGSVAAQQEIRLQQMQQQMAAMQGQVEDLQLKVNDLGDKLERAQKDNEFRLNALEGGQGGTGAANPAGAPNPPGAAPGAIAAPDAATGNSSLGGGTANSPAAGPSTAAEPPASGQPHILGTLTDEQAKNLPQAPAGAAEAAAAAAAGTGASQAAAAGGGNIVLPGETPREQYEYATNLLQKGQYPEAEVALKTFVKDHPSDPLAGNAQYWLGETFYVRSDFKNAAVAFAEGYQKYPNSQKAPDNLLKLGMALGQSGQKENACVALKQLDKKFPDASSAIKDRTSRAKQRFGCS
ncbi:MAG: tol-pal system protein YbgF [Dongiaceae bacterium]